MRTPGSEMEKAHLILYVAEQERSREFYEAALHVVPILHVPGMTEFPLPGGAVLGLMPVAGIKRLLGDSLPDPTVAWNIPRAELYLMVTDPESFLDRALKAGGRKLSDVAPRDWGHAAGYCLDPDGHVLAFAGTIQK